MRELMSAEGAWLHVAEVVDEINHSSSVGISSTLESIDLKEVVSFKDGIVNRLYGGLQGLIKAAGITVVEGEGKLVGPKRNTKVKEMPY